MDDVISINSTIFISGISDMESASQNLPGDAITWTSLGEISEPFNEFLECFFQLQNIMCLYQTLSVNDINAVSSIGNAYMSVDTYISDMIYGG